MIDAADRYIDKRHHAFVAIQYASHGDLRNVGFAVGAKAVTQADLNRCFMIPSRLILVSRSTAASQVWQPHRTDLQSDPDSLLTRIRSVFSPRQLASEMAEPAPGSELVVNRLADMLFIQCIRAYIGSRSERGSMG